MRAFIILISVVCICDAKTGVMPLVSEEKIDEVFGHVADLVLSHVTQFDEDHVNVILEQLRLKTKTSDHEYEVNPAFLRFLGENDISEETATYSLSFEHIVSPYDGSVEVFVDRMLALNRENPSIVSTLIQLAKQIPPEEWSTGLAAALAPIDLSEPIQCHKHSDLTRAITSGIHACLVYDTLTRILFKSPTTWLKAVDDYFSSFFDQLKVAGSGAFWLVKFPSVRTPIKAFIASSTTNKLRAKRQSQQEMEEDEMNETLSRLTLRLAKFFIKSDPTTALRQNILEASYAEAFVFLNHFSEFEIKDFPPNTYAGLVLKSDNMFGSPARCDPNCQEVFGRGKFTFTDSGAWMHLYSSWNLAFTMSTGDIFEWWAKLLAPAVLEDTTGEEYIIRRAIALYLALNRTGFKLDTLNRLLEHYKLTKTPFTKPDECRLEYSFKDQFAVQHEFGKENKKFGQRFQKLWKATDKCPRNLKMSVLAATMFVKGASGANWTKNRLGDFKDWFKHRIPAT